MEAGIIKHTIAYSLGFLVLSIVDPKHSLGFTNPGLRAFFKLP